MANDQSRLDLPFVGIPTFARVPAAQDLTTLEADVAILGIPLDITTQYRPGARFGPRGIRESSLLSPIGADGVYDPERDEMFLEPKWRIVDCGDVDMIHGDLEQSFANVRRAIEQIVARGAMPVSLGGDHSITIPVLQALASRGPFGLIQFDAHLDFVNERHGQRFGQGSPIRRASELPHVTKIAQLGIRGIGSSSRQDFDDARAYGNLILSPRQIRARGIPATLDALPVCERYYVTIDCDGLDPALAPGTGTPSPGGFDYDEMQAMLEGIAARGEIVGFDVTEVAPVYDPTERTTQVMARLILDFLGFILKQKAKSKNESQ
jgi:agmatinase